MRPVIYISMYYGTDTWENKIYELNLPMQGNSVYLMHFPSLFYASGQEEIIVWWQTHGNPGTDLHNKTGYYWFKPADCPITRGYFTLH